MSSIRPIAICLFYSSGKILVGQGFDHVKGTCFCRPLGGGIEFGETSRETIVREIREEIDADVINLRLIGVINPAIFAGCIFHSPACHFSDKFLQIFYEANRSRLLLMARFDAVWLPEWRACKWLTKFRGRPNGLGLARRDSCLRDCFINAAARNSSQLMTGAV